MPIILCRVVCAFAVMIERFSPTSLFISEDLPTLGLPTILTKPDLNPFCSIKRQSYLFFTTEGSTFVPPIEKEGTKFAAVAVIVSRIYRGVEQLVARWAHNPKVTSSSL